MPSPLGRRLRRIMKTLIDAAKEFSMGEMSYTEFNGFVNDNEAALGRAYANYLEAIMTTRNTPMIESTLNNLAYIIENYGDENV